MSRKYFVDFSIYSLSLNQTNSHPISEDIEIDFYKKININCDLINSASNDHTIKMKYELCLKYDMNSALNLYFSLNNLIFHIICTYFLLNSILF
jgi:hypothetical protein